MIRKLALFGSALALAGSSLFVAGGATAAGTPVDTSTASVTCNTLLGASGSIKPPLSDTTTTGTILAIKIKGTFSGCTTGAATAIASGGMSGTLSATVPAPGGCASIANPIPLTGTVTVKWKTSDKTKLDHSSTIVNTTTLTPIPNAQVDQGGTPLWPAAYPVFQISGTLAAGSAFGGGTPSFQGLISQDVLTLAGLCAGAGVKSTPFGAGTFTG